LSRSRIRVLLLVVLFLFLSLAANGLNERFVRGADIAGWTASTAANARVINVSERWLPYGVGQPLPELNAMENLLYLHQSPLPYYLTAGAFAVFGAKEWVARIVPLLLTLAAGFLLYRLLARLWDPRVAVIGLAAFWLNPTTVTFGMSNNHIVIGQFTVLLALWAWVSASEPAASRRATAAAFACTVLAMWTYWHAYFLPLFFAYAEARLTPPKDRSYRRAALWLALPALSFALHLLLYFAAYAPGPVELVSTALNRSGIKAGAWKPLRTVNELGLELASLWHVGFTSLALAFLAMRFTSYGKPLGKNQKVFLLSLGGAPILYWVFMARIASAEPMLNLVLVAPFVAACFACGAVEALRGRLLILAVPVIVLSVAQIAVDHDKWQERLYSHRSQEAVQVGLLARDLSRDGDVIFEDGYEIGPGVLAYYARGRAVINAENFLFQPRRHPSVYLVRVLRKLSPERTPYLVTTAERLRVSELTERLQSEGYRLQRLRDFSVWQIMRIERIQTGSGT
jgi:hypothetical protein